MKKFFTTSNTCAWAEWYRDQRGIPAENMLGLSASTSEHLADLVSAQAEVFDPVKGFLSANPDIEQRIMGIVLGYRLPSHYGSPPLVPNVGGYSIANGLQDVTNKKTWEMNLDCPHAVAPYGAMPVGGRLTKATMRPGHYMVAQIDGPTLDDAKALTLRAKAIVASPRGSGGPLRVWYDYKDPVLPGGEWYWLKRAVTSPDFAEVPWQSFNDDTDQTPADMFRLGAHDLVGWNGPRLFGAPAGPRLLAFNYNSFGATTVRSGTAEGGRYVPNALAAGYAAAIGATGEPQCCVGPFPDTLLGSIRAHWTLGEAFYLANPYDDWMWTVLGDPFLVDRLWFNETLAGDINNDGRLNLRDFAGLRACMNGPGENLPAVCDPFDIDGDGDCDLFDFAEFQTGCTGEPVAPPGGDYDVDGDVDLNDYAGFETCISEPGPTSLPTGCDVFDFDYDLDADLVDFQVLQQAF